MTIQYISDKVPQYIHNKYTNYENTVLQEHSNIVGSLKDTTALETLVESQARLYIGLCKRDKSQKFIEDNFQGYYNSEIEKLKTQLNGNIGLTEKEKKDMATNRTWLRLINEAVSEFINRYKVDGSKAKIAVIDDLLPDGRKIMEVEDIPDVVKKFFSDIPQFSKGPVPPTSYSQDESQ
jgi:hypothetical protein